MPGEKPARGLHRNVSHVYPKKSAYRHARMPIDGRPDMPVKYVYGMQDPVISVGRAKDTVNYLGQDNVKFYPALSHWLLTEDPSATANDIIEFLGRSVATE